ncbi:MAG: MarR family transcriptional regulator [Ignavibacteriaceae bacterium]
MKLESEIVQKKFKNEYHKAIVNIVFTYNWMIEKQTKQLRPYDISLQQYNILRILRGQHPNPATVKLIKERMLDKMSDVSRLVEKLRVKELVERDICQHDRRNVDVLITNKGLELLKELEPKENEMEKFMSNLNEKEIEHLNIYLDKLRG